MTNQRGVALVIVLWLIVLLGAIAAGHVRNVHSEIAMAMSHTAAAKARALAEAGIQHAIFHLLQQNKREAWPVNGTVRKVQFEGREIQIAIRDARGLVDLNRANAQLLGQLFYRIEQDEQQRQKLVDALLDWRDADNFTHLQGAEDSDYHAAGLHWSAHDDALTSIEELRYVIGMTPERFADIAPFVTVHSGQPGLDLHFASPALISLLTGQNEASLIEESLVQERPDQPQATSRSGVYHIYASAFDRKNVFVSVEAVIEITADTKQPYRVLSRHEPARFANWRGRSR